MSDKTYKIAPLRDKKVHELPWEGDCFKKPWKYLVTAMLPCLDAYEFLKINIELLRLQTIKPYIVIVDTGSCDEELEKTLSLRDEDVEVHSLRLNGVLHPSDFPAMAMDTAFAVCRTQYAYATHTDCFLRRRDFIEYLLNTSKEEKTPVVGYEMSPRSHDDWKGMISHTASLYHMPTMDKIGFGWSLRRLCNMHDISNYTPDPMRPNWPDTEILGNYILRYYKIKTKIIGHDTNFERYVDDNIDHCRSYTSGKLYSKEYYRKAQEWVDSAMKEAKERIDLWQNKHTQEHRGNRIPQQQNV